MSTEHLRNALENFITTFEVRELEWGQCPLGGEAYMKEIRQVFPDNHSQPVLLGNNVSAAAACGAMDLLLKGAKTALEQDPEDKYKAVCQALAGLSSFECDINQGAEAMFFLICKLRKMAKAALEGRLQITKILEELPPPPKTQLKQLKEIEGMPTEKLIEILDQQ